MNRRKKNFFVSKSFMGRRTGLPQNDHHRAIGMLEAGMTKNYVAVSFGVCKIPILHVQLIFDREMTRVKLVPVLCID
jgi:hypothetical protein